MLELMSMLEICIEVHILLDCVYLYHLRRPVTYVVYFIGEVCFVTIMVPYHVTTQLSLIIIISKGCIWPMLIKLVQRKLQWLTILHIFYSKLGSCQYIPGITSGDASLAWYCPYFSFPLCCSGFWILISQLPAHQ